MTNNQYLALSLFLLLFLWLISIAPSSNVAQEDLMTLSENGSGRATAYSKTNKIVTIDGKTHVAWLDSDKQGFVVRIRTLDRIKNQWSETHTIGAAVDNHGGPALAVDSQNYLHVVYGPHHGPFSHRKSLRPNDASEWSEVTEFGNKLTYPSLMVAPDDTLIVVARMSSSGPWGVVAHFKPPGEGWSEPRHLIKAAEPRYSQFHVSLAWGPKHQTLHLATRMYGDTPAWGYKVGYMQTKDFGKSWQTHSGEAIELPATRTTIDTIRTTPTEQRLQHESGSALAGGLVAVDSTNVPHVLYHSLGNEGGVPHETWIASPDAENGGWKQMPLNDRIKVRPASASLSTPGGFSIDDLGRWNLALTMTDNPDSPGVPFGTDRNEVVWARSLDNGSTFESKLISKADANTPNWLPNIERQTGFNQVENPGVIFTSGPKGTNLTDILQNRVYWFQEK